MKKTLLIISLAITLAGCSKSDNVVNNYTPPPPTSGANVISAGGTSFSTSTLTAKVGDTLTFVWTSGTHTTTSTAVPSGAATWDAPLTSSSTVFKYIITKTGTYSYKCTFHESMGMSGTVTVN
jgi:plastocyanin